MQKIFAETDNVDVIAGDWSTLEQYAPFSLLFVDVREVMESIDVLADLLEPGGIVVLDDFVPSAFWPPIVEGRVDTVREQWLDRRAVRRRRDADRRRRLADHRHPPLTRPHDETLCPVHDGDPDRPRRPMHLRYAVAGALAVGLYVLLPDGTVRDDLYLVIGLSCVAAILLGIRINRPAATTPWLLMAAGQACWVAGDWLFDETTTSVVAASDVMSLAAYPCWSPGSAT